MSKNKYQRNTSNRLHADKPNRQLQNYQRTDLTDVNSPTRDQQILFDRAGNSQDMGDQHQPAYSNSNYHAEGWTQKKSEIQSRSIHITNQKRDDPDNYYSYSPARRPNNGVQRQSNQAQSQKGGNFNFSNAIYSVDQQPKQVAKYNPQNNQRPLSRLPRPAHSRKDPPLLKPQKEGYIGRKTLVLDLDETLVHSSFKKIKNVDIKQPIDIDGFIQTVYVNVRPYAEEFILYMSKFYEIIMFTASISKYAMPIFNKIDPQRKCQTMLFREHCTIDAETGYMVKDLTRLGRKIENVIIIDNSANSYYFQPENALPSLSWIKDRADYELKDMVPFLKKLAEPQVKDVRQFLSKVVDVTQGSKTPIFNRKKAGQLIKLMDDPSCPLHQGAYKAADKPSLKQEIARAQEEAYLRSLEAQESREKQEKYMQKQQANVQQSNTTIYKPLLSEEHPQSEHQQTIPSYRQKTIYMQTNLSQKGADQPRKSYQSETAATAQRRPEQSAQGQKQMYEKAYTSTRDQQKASGRELPQTNKANSQQPAKDSMSTSAKDKNAIQTNNIQNAQRLQRDNAGPLGHEKQPTPPSQLQVSQPKAASYQTVQHTQQPLVSPPVDFDELDDDDVNQITNYYYAKYKSKKRRKSSLCRELKKIDEKDNSLSHTLAELAAKKGPGGRSGSTKNVVGSHITYKHNTEVNADDQELYLKKELEKKREEILHKFTQLDHRSLEDEEPKKVSYTKQLLSQQKMQRLNAHVPVDEKIVFMGYNSNKQKKKPAHNVVEQALQHESSNQQRRSSESVQQNRSTTAVSNVQSKDNGGLGGVDMNGYAEASGQSQITIPSHLQATEVAKTESVESRATTIHYQTISVNKEDDVSQPQPVLRATQYENLPEQINQAPTPSQQQKLSLSLMSVGKGDSPSKLDSKALGPLKTGRSSQHSQKSQYNRPASNRSLVSSSRKAKVQNGIYAKNEQLIHMVQHQPQQQRSISRQRNKEKVMTLQNAEISSPGAKILQKRKSCEPAQPMNSRLSRNSSRGSIQRLHVTNSTKSIADKSQQSLLRQYEQKINKMVLQAKEVAEKHTFTHQMQQQNSASSQFKTPGTANSRPQATSSNQAPKHVLCLSSKNAGVASAHNSSTTHAKRTHSSKKQNSAKTLNLDTFERQIDKSNKTANQQKKYTVRNINTNQTLGNPSTQPKSALLNFTPINKVREHNDRYKLNDDKTIAILRSHGEPPGSGQKQGNEPKLNNYFNSRSVVMDKGGQGKGAEVLNNSIEQLKKKNQMLKEQFNSMLKIQQTQKGGMTLQQRHQSIKVLAEASELKVSETLQPSAQKAGQQQSNKYFNSKSGSMLVGNDYSRFNGKGKAAAQIKGIEQAYGLANPNKKSEASTIDKQPSRMTHSAKTSLSAQNPQSRSNRFLHQYQGDAYHSVSTTTDQQLKAQKARHGAPNQPRGNSVKSNVAVRTSLNQQQLSNQNKTAQSYISAHQTKSQKYVNQQHHGGPSKIGYTSIKGLFSKNHMKF